MNIYSVSHSKELMEINTYNIYYKVVGYDSLYYLMIGKILGF